MTITPGAVVTVVQPGAGDRVAMAGFGAVFKLTSRTTAGLVAIVEVITPGGGFENYFHELSELLTSMADGQPTGTPLHESPEFTELDDIVARYGLTPPSH